MKFNWIVPGGIMSVSGPTTDVGSLVESTFAEFEKNLKLLRDFGLTALKNALDQRRKEQGLGQEITSNMVKDAMGISTFNQLLEKNDEMLKAFSQQMATYNQPRADLKDRPELNAGVTAGRKANFAPAPWASKMDIAADPAIRDAINQVTADLNDPKNEANLTFSFDDLRNKLDNKLRNELKLRNEYKNKLTSTPRLTR